ncbi:uncharacterized protein LOC130894286 [Diorhabda carinulata]|uniref:uncharacterized protein LOC130894286 n=1 Tax=Diorhabda carinulata TaxID=1163345 RepID=UPI0025A13B1A|nr:uncharacterized protein LOC130894286 [Diorhabda carinulata]
MVLNTELSQVEVIDLVNDGSGLAFGIIGGRSTGVVVKTIIPGGVADRDGRLQSGDHILQIGEVNLRGLGSEQVAAVLRQCGVHVRLVVARPIESANLEFQMLSSMAPIVPTKILGDPVELDRHLSGEAFAYQPSPSTFHRGPYIYTGHHSEVQLQELVPYLARIGTENNFPEALPMTFSYHEPELPETETYEVELKKDDLGLGITVAGYVCEKEEISGIFVKSISQGSAADLTQNIRINDRIVEVNGVSLIGFTNHQAVEFLRNSGFNVKIKLERYLRGPKYEQLQQAIKANELRPPSPPSPTLTSLPKVPLSMVQMDYLSIEPDGESRTSFEFDSAILLETMNIAEEEKEILIGGEIRSFQFKIESHEIIHEKWKNKFEDDVEIVIAQMKKEPTSGLGISLEGTVDVEDGQEVRPHHYIRNILPDGPVGQNGILQSGDELLEVNGIQLLGLNHLEVVTILKQLPSVVSIVCARYPVHTRIIDTSQHPEAFRARKILAGSLQTLIPISETNHLMKAKSESSLSSSIISEAISRSRSLEVIQGMPMWNEEPIVVELVKGDYGLGFSILDYQDPLYPQKNVIVIRSLVPGGVAQSDGRLIPGDRLLSVNDITVEHSSLDEAVNVLKGAPKGIVKLIVAKPLTCGDAVSHTSQDTEEDHTCLEDFQECIEEFQECLDTMNICIDDDNSCSHSFNSDVEDLGEKAPQCNKNDLFRSNHINRTKPKSKYSDSDVDSSFDSDKQTLKIKENCVEFNKQLNKFEIFSKNDSLLSDKFSEKDDYETCVEESWSEEISVVKISNNTEIKSVESLVQINDTNINCILDVIDSNDVTPTNSKVNLDQLCQEVPDTNSKIYNTTVNTASSEPCLNKDFVTTHICLDSKLDDELKSYDNNINDPGDEFFIVSYNQPNKSIFKSLTELNIIGSYEFPSKRSYRKCLKEYYNDYADCLEAYKISLSDTIEQEEMSDDDIFKDIFLPFKSKSTPDIIDRSFVMITYDPGPDNMTRRKSAFTPGYQYMEPEMTVIQPIEIDVRGCQVEEMLQKHWGSTHTVHLFREPNKSLGINIVGGKVDLQVSKQSPDTLLGIFVKSVVPNSPAGKTGMFKVGDRILEVSGIDLREATHEKAVQAIRNASNPVTFIIQSLIPWKITDNDTKENGCSSPFPSPVSNRSSASYNKENNQIKEINGNTPRFKGTDGIISNEIQLSKTATQVEHPATDDSSMGANLNVVITQVTPIHAPLSTNINTNTFNKDVGDKLDNEFQENEKEHQKSTSPAIYESESEEDDDEEDDVRELEGRTVSAKGYAIDRASAGNVKRTKEEIIADTEAEDDYGYTMNKVKKKYASLGNNILMVQLERSNQGLGLSLAGHKDRNCMAVFVCGLNPKGVAYKTGSIQIGDEILEVNGVVLHGRCHLNASAIIKGLSGPTFKVIILRRKTAIDDIAVKPITQFPVSLAEEASEEQFSASYPNVRTVAVKKQPNQSLGIMIIEGKHAEVGQGIFISDIQEGSSAEKAGLEIGELILAVNKDSLVGSNYETAANLLKRTEGLVTLVVSNPGKKDPASSSTLVPNISSNSIENKNATSKPSTLKATTPSSRPTTPVPEPPADPLTCSIIPGKETTIEIASDNKGLGVFFVGGKDTQIQNAIIIVEIYPGGSADIDKRLQPGDNILDVNGTSLKDVSHTTASQALRQTLPKMKIVVYRPNTIEYSPIETELVKKPGKGLGISVVARKSGKGVYIADIISGSVAELDGKIARGDLLISVNGHNVENVGGEEAGAILKTATGRVSLKLNRYKPTAR